MKKSFQDLIGESIDKLTDELLEEKQKLEEIDDRIMKSEVIERLNMKEIKSEILNEIKIFKKINTEIQN